MVNQNLIGQSYEALSSQTYFQLQYDPYDILYFGLIINVSQFSSYQVAFEINIAQNTLQPATSLYDEDNPFQPTVAIDGTIIIANPATNPGNTQLTETFGYIQWLDAGITGISWTDLWNFSAELDYNGGSFSITSKIPLMPEATNYVTFEGSTANMDILATGQLGQQVTIFGLNASITAFGPIVNDSQAGWVTQGIFGNLNLHKNFLFLAYGNNPILGILTSPALQALGSGGNNSYPTCKMVAQVLAQEVGITLQWYCQDLGLTNTFNVDGLTVIEALNQLAQMVGGQLRWDGNINYIVAYPNQYIGYWEVPDCRFLTTNGASSLQYYDLETGVEGTGLIILPYKFRNTNNPAIPPVTFPPPITTVVTLTSVPSSSAPPIIQDLPYNYENVYIQILVPPGGSTAGTNTVSEQNWITEDPNSWFTFDAASLTGLVAAGPLATETEYVFTYLRNNTYTPAVAVDYKLFPSSGQNSNIDNNQFTMRIGVSTQSISTAVNPNLSLQTQLYLAQLAANFFKYQFIKTYTGTFTCQFFGSIPLPGMWGRVVIPGGATVVSADGTTVSIPGILAGQKLNVLPGPPTGSFSTQTTSPVNPGDLIVEGIIERVQIGYPGVITVQLAQYAELNYSYMHPGGITTLSVGSIDSPY